MVAAAQTPAQIVPEVSHREAQRSVTAPLTYMHLLVTKQIRRVLAVTNDDQRADRDAVGARRDGAADPQSIALAVLPHHVRNAIPGRTGQNTGVLFFRMNTVTLIVVLIAVLGSFAAAGVLVGRRLRSRGDSFHGPIGVVQGTLLGLVGLLLAFGLTMAVGRYEDRRALVVREADDIGTTYLRAQTLTEPARTDSMALLAQYADAAVDLAGTVPGSTDFEKVSSTIDDLQAKLWTSAGEALRSDPNGNASRLYIESLNPMFDRHTDRVASLNNLVPTPVLLLEVFGSAVALGVLGLYLSLLGRGLTTTVVATTIVFFILFVSFDLDRPQRGFIRVPATALEQVQDLTRQPPAIQAAP